MNRLSVQINPSLKIWLFALLASSFTFLLFGSISIHRTPPPPLNSSSFTLSYMPYERPDNTDGADTWMWSPSIFSLSSSEGFSRLKQRSRHLPPNPQRRQTVLRTPRANTNEGVRFTSTPIYLQDRLKRQFSTSTLTPAISNIWGYSITSNKLLLTTADLDDPDRPWVSQHIDGELKHMLDTPWKAEARLIITPEGYPQSVLLTQKSGVTEIDHKLLQMLYRWRLSRGVRHAVAKISIHCQNSAQSGGS